MFFLARASVAIGVVVSAVLLHGSDPAGFGAMKVAATRLAADGVGRWCASATACRGLVDPLGRVTAAGLAPAVSRVLPAWVSDRPVAMVHAPRARS